MVAIAKMLNWPVMFTAPRWRRAVPGSTCSGDVRSAFGQTTPRKAPRKEQGDQKLRSQRPPMIA